MVISFVNEKGGVGKTTLATNVACGLSRRGIETAIVDTDLQGTATIWGQVQDPPLVPVHTHEASDLVDGVPPAIQDAGVILVDTPGTLSGITVEAIRTSDVTVIPVQPSAADLWAAQDAIELVRERQSVAGIPLLRVVMSNGKVGTRLTRETSEAIVSLGVTPFDGGTHNREVYKRALGGGTSVFASSDKKAKAEINTLVDSLLHLYEPTQNERS